MEIATLVDMQKLAILAVEKFLKKIKNVKKIEKFFEKNLHFIIKSMVKLYKTHHNNEHQKKIVTICENLIENYKRCINDKEFYIREFSVHMQFANVVNILNTLPNSNETVNDWQKSFDPFLDNNNNTIDGLKTLQRNVSYNNPLNKINSFSN